MSSSKLGNQSSSGAAKSTAKSKAKATKTVSVGFKVNDMVVELTNEAEVSARYPNMEAAKQGLKDIGKLYKVKEQDAQEVLNRFTDAEDQQKKEAKRLEREQLHKRLKELEDDEAASSSAAAASSSAAARVPEPVCRSDAGEGEGSEEVEHDGEEESEEEEDGEGDQPEEEVVSVPVKKVDKAYEARRQAYAARGIRMDADIDAAPRSDEEADVVKLAKGRLAKAKVIDARRQKDSEDELEKQIQKAPYSKKK